MTAEEQFEKEIHNNHFRVAIFGSARIKPEDPYYHEIFDLAKMLADEGIDVVTGGGPGLMEAANAGHRTSKNDPNVHSFGLNIKLPSEQVANPHLDIKRDFERFSQRLDTFMELSNAVIIAPGGVGTMLEFYYTWQLSQVQHICSIPIILLGEMWAEHIEWIEKWQLNQGFLEKKDLSLLFVAKNPSDVMKVIRKAHETFQKGGKDFCINFQRYHID